MVYIVPSGKLFTGSCQTLALSWFTFWWSNNHRFCLQLPYPLMASMVWTNCENMYSNTNCSFNLGQYFKCLYTIWLRTQQINYISKSMVDKDGWLRIGKLSNNCVSLKKLFFWIFIVTKLDGENRIFYFCYFCSGLSINNTSCYFRTNRSLITISHFQIFVSIFSKRIDIWQKLIWLFTLKGNKK